MISILQAPILTARRHGLHLQASAAESFRGLNQDRGMPGTLLAYDAAFPRAATVLSTPSAQQLQDHHYPTPHQLLSCPSTQHADVMGRQMALSADLMGRLDVLIIFGHGIITNGVTRGILISADQLVDSNLWALDQLRGKFVRGGRIELWVCAAASSTTGGGRSSGSSYCQLMADRVGVDVLAAEDLQGFLNSAQRNVADTGLWLTESYFLPWEGTVRRFRPRG